MSESQKPGNGEEAPKKISLAEAVRNKLAQQKQDQHNENNGQGQKNGNMTAKSQMTKKVNNQRRRTGGS